MDINPNSRFGVPDSSDVPVPEIEPIDRLRQRLAHAWSHHKTYEAFKRGGKKRGDRYNPIWDDPEWYDSQDSFCVWVMAQPESLLRKWVVETGKEFAKKSDVRTVSTDWRKSLDEALPLIFNLGNVCDSVDPQTKQERGHQKFVSMEELTSSPDYQTLSESAKWAARWCIERQKQNADGSWHIVPERGEMTRSFQQ